MTAVEIIRKKRDGEALTDEELSWFCREAGNGGITDYQVSAFLMTAFLRGLSDVETAALTRAMLYSGEVVDLSDLPGVKVDKHSTGGVGDTTTLVVAPLAAACGAVVAKMSGRGLGHTGGTLDKLESIPGVTTSIDMARFRQQVRKIGLAVIGQTADLVPADRKFYAIRDVTATVDSIPLIASSIMSKKLAAGTSVIVLDVKFGHGAFMRTLEEARELARLMVSIGEQLGRQVRAVITRMDAPLGRRIGNALEVLEALEESTAAARWRKSPWCSARICWRWQASHPTWPLPAAPRKRSWRPARRWRSSNRWWRRRGATSRPSRTVCLEPRSRYL
ncbi:MAG: thymidine phosphorylase [Candidatus Xenobia bacterium]